MTDPSPQEYDVLIIGAGVNGAGVFRDLCEQGMRCLIIDKGDFGAGTSAAPSRLIHGGLKYLETGDFRLVAESTYERNLLLRNAAHMVTPLPTIIPIYSWTRGIWPALRTFFGARTAPRSRGALLVKLGLAIYDFYGAKARQMPRHRMIGRTRARAGLPALTPDIVATGTYYDAAISAPERLVLELLQDGIAAQPASEVRSWTSLQGQGAGCLVIAGPDGQTRRVRARAVVNAAGPWIDGVNTLLGQPTRLIGGTKGAHVILDHPDLLRQLNGRMIYFESDDGRILLVFPFLGKALVGSTDIPDRDPDHAQCTAAETDYFLSSLRQLLPGLKFHADHIVFSYAGVRPLPNSDGTAPGLISRDHSAPMQSATAQRPFPVISLVGGKWTTFRAFAAEITDTVLGQLGAERRVSTDDLPIGGGRDLPRSPTDRHAWIADVAGHSGGQPDRIGALLARYGSTARAIALQEGPAPVLIGQTTYSEAEITWLARNERVQHLQDVILRRTALAITGQLTAAVFDHVARVVAQALGWSETRIEQERRDARVVLAQRHGIPDPDRTP